MLELIKATTALSHYQKYIDELNAALESIDHSEIEQAIKLIKDAQVNQHTVFIIGNGGSASTASHWATDMGKGLHHSGKIGIKAMSLSDNIAWISAAANDIDYDSVFSDQLRAHAKRGDLLISISASGQSKNIIKAIRHAKKAGLETLSIVGFNGGKAKVLSDHCIHIPTKAGRYGVVEDIQLIINHYICDYLVEGTT
jgi:D-sedoheptulose 7-phosphate isomerase